MVTFRSRMFTALVLVTVLLAPCTFVAHAQTQDGPAWESLRKLPHGTRVRVVVGRAALNGRFQSATDVDLRIEEQGRALAIPRLDVRQVVSLEKTRRKRNVAIGLGIGAAAGAGLGAATGGTGPENFAWVYGALVGALIGGLIGSLNKQHLIVYSKY